MRQKKNSYLRLGIGEELWGNNAGGKDNFCLFHNSVKGFLSTLFLFFKFYIGAQLIDNVELVSGVQQSDSVIYIYIC